MTIPNPPRDLRRAFLAVLVVAAVHLVALVLIALHVDVIRGATAAAHPDLAADRIDALTRSQVFSSVVPHVVLALVLPWRAWALRSGRRSARIILTVLLGLQLLAHATLPVVLRELPGYAGWVIAVQAFSLVFELLALWLIWVPAPVREFFRAPRGAAAPV
jgi:hypothetical protein